MVKLRWPSRAVHILPLTTALLVGCNQSEQVSTASAPVEVGVYTVKAESLVMTTDLPGRTSAYRVAQVRPQVSGILQKRLFEEGAQVKEGQQLYQIDPATYQATLARAQANLDTAQNLAKRYASLLETKAISRQQHDDAQAAWKQAKADVQVASINVQYTKVLSPISGRIGRSNITEGALVTNGQGTELATVNQLDPIYVDVTQPITRMLALERALESGSLQSTGAGQAHVTLTLDDGSAYPLPGTLKFSEVSVDPGTGSVTLRAVFPNPNGKLLPGMFVHAQLKEGVREAAKLVPQQGIIRDSRGVATAWVIKPDETVELRELQTLRTVGNAWLVGKGIEAGEQVVTEGVQRLRAGAKVKASPATNVELISDFSATTGEGS
ncbi:efflux RND transporter periplasmic adaptor subunit [Pseudomonas sp. W15Feb34]|nr:efflux RND transporter periplasmic adaptor subunit [Pseudomonas sp. W15Feb34]MCK3864712.1 efflux RND transporter periplasmic adaptor subunit [Pseudomonas sp. B329]